MPKYRKKPVVVEAVQYSNEMRVNDCLPDDVVICYWRDGAPDGPGDYPTVKTLEGMMLVSEGDYIITGVQGEKYPCKPAIFEATYEFVE